MDSPSSYKIVIVDLRTCHGFVGRRVGYKISFLGIKIYIYFFQFWGGGVKILVVS